MGAAPGAAGKRRSRGGIRLAACVHDTDGKLTCCRRQRKTISAGSSVPVHLAQRDRGCRVRFVEAKEDPDLRSGRTAVHAHIQ